MSLDQHISVNTHYTRSINLERDADHIDVIKSYIPTSRALRTLERITQAFSHEQAPRAWSLIGPYGSGKSSYSVFLSQLLSENTKPATQAALDALRKANPEIAKQFRHQTKDGMGYLKVLITGAPEPLGNRLLRGLAEAAEKYWNSRRGKNPAIVIKLVKAASRGEITAPQLIEHIKLLQQQLAQTGCPGMLLIIDELGKFLEYEARHYGTNDIYLLQTLAEHACEANDVNLLMFVMLHQSFEQYAKGLGETLKNEWAKVQGRFEDIPFVESPEQVLRVVSAAFQQNLKPGELRSLKAAQKKTTITLSKENALPATLAAKETTDLFLSCYPLHPVSAWLLPLLCQKVAQNERTLFSYLGSHEEFGLQHMLLHLDKLGSYIYPHHIYDYFIANQPSVLGNYLTHRRWVEVITAIERLGDAPEAEVNLLKTIGILNIVGGKGGFKASKVLLALCNPNAAAFRHALKALNEKSIINYRRFNNEYRVWQGSDFDLEEAYEEELGNLGQLSPAQELSQSRPMLPVVARRYTIQTGTLRYFEPAFVDRHNYETIDSHSHAPRILFYFAGDNDDIKRFHNDVVRRFSSQDIVVFCRSGVQLKEAIAETLALKRVQVSRQELNTDPVAKREFEDRLDQAENRVDELLRDLIDSPEENDWFHKGRALSINNKRDLQVMLSDVLEQIYAQSPRIFNELINRDRPSSQANAARNKLLAAMMNNESEVDLGIDKFPPEKAIYRTVLKELKLHQPKKNDGGDETWHFIAPSNDGRKDSANIHYVWQCMEAFFDSTEKAARPFAELNEQLMAPPFGVKAGVLPILYLTAYIVNQHELALYENGRYQPYFNGEMLERFVKRPDEYSVQRFRIEGLNASIFEQYSKVIHGDTRKRTILDLVRPLAKFTGNLPLYTQKTRRGLSKRTLAVRQVFDLAKSPEQLLFNDLPAALGFTHLSTGGQKELEEFAQSLTNSLRDLKNAYEQLLENQKKLLAQAFSIDTQLPLIELRSIVAGHCHGLGDYTVDRKGLGAFINRLTKAQDDENEWLENVLMFLGHKPPSKWLDSDGDEAEYRLAEFSRRIIDLEKLRLHEKDVAAKTTGEFDVYLLRSVKKGSEIKDEVVAVDKQRAKRIESARAEINKALSGLSDNETRLAALAETVEEFLTEYQLSHRTQGIKTNSPKSKRQIQHKQ